MGFWEIVLLALTILAVIIFLKTSSLKINNRKLIPLKTRIVISILAPLLILIALLIISTLFAFFLAIGIILFLASLLTLKTVRYKKIKPK